LIETEALLGIMPSKPSSTHTVRPLSKKDERALRRLRAISMALPEAVEKISHGEPTWFAGKGKVFAMFDSHHHGAEHLAVWLPQPLGVQEALIREDPDRFFRPPYVGPNGWIGVVLDDGPDWQVVATLVRDAYLQVATRKLKLRLEEEPLGQS
jgi:hypothetical protein